MTSGATPNTQSGFALIALLAVVGGVLAVLLVKGLSTSELEQARQRKTAQALATAKEALIAWSISRGDFAGNARPGELPCPASDTSGSEAGTCSAGKIGRLPWKTLGIEELHDGSGEQLWYAVAGPFRKRVSNGQAINSDTRATLQLYDADGMTLLTASGDELAAVILAPGATLAGQDRTGAGVNAAANYLEQANGRSNAVSGGPFIRGPIRDAADNLILNDQVLGISGSALIHAAEKRVLNEAQSLLARFASDHPGKYPNPAPPTCTTVPNPSTPNTCDSDPTRCFGRLPEDVATFPSSPPYDTPDWFRVNGWGRVMTYAVNKTNAIDNTAAECSTAVSVDGAPKDFVLITPGTPKGTIARPSANVADYLEDASNVDAWSAGAPGQPDFAAPSGSSNDQLRSAP